MLGENPIEEAKRVLSDPLRAQRMQRLLNTKHELRNARISSALIFVSALGLASIQIWRYAERGHVDHISCLLAGLMTISFLLSVPRLLRASAAYKAEHRSAA